MSLDHLIGGQHAMQKVGASAKYACGVLTAIFNLTGWANGWAIIQVLQSTAMLNSGTSVRDRIAWSTHRQSGPADAQLQGLTGIETVSTHADQSEPVVSS